MRIIILLTLVFLFSQTHAQSYKKIHRAAIFTDTHNDILMKSVEEGVVIDQDLTGKTHSDLARLKQAGIDLQVFSVYCDGDTKNAFAFANREMDTLYAVAKRNPDKIAIVYSYA